MVGSVNVVELIESICIIFFDEVGGIIILIVC